MDQQNSTLKVLGPIIGVLLLAYVINLGIRQFNQDRTVLGEASVTQPVSNVEESADQGDDVEESETEVADEAADEATDEEMAAEEVAAEEPAPEEEEMADEEIATEEVATEEASTEEVTAEEVAAEEVAAEESTEEAVEPSVAESAETTDEENQDESALATVAAQTEENEDGEEDPDDAEQSDETGNDDETAGDNAETESETSDLPAAGSTGSVAIEIQAGDLFFGEGGNNLAEPPIWAVGSSQEIALTFNNMGGVQHNWAVLNLGVEEVPIPFFEDDNAELLFYNPGLQDAGTQFEDTFTAPAELGEYLVICTAPGHYPLMQGRLVVE